MNPDRLVRGLKKQAHFIIIRRRAFFCEVNLLYLKLNMKENLALLQKKFFARRSRRERSSSCGRATGRE
jgi:hypothetical protein